MRNQNKFFANFDPNFHKDSDPKTRLWFAFNSMNSTFGKADEILAMVKDVKKVNENNENAVLLEVFPANLQDFVQFLTNHNDKNSQKVIQNQKQCRFSRCLTLSTRVQKGLMGTVSLTYYFHKKFSSLFFSLF